MNLLDLARRQRWSTLAVRAETHPHEIFTLDENCFSPLHWMCFNRPDPRAVRAVLSVCARLGEERGGGVDGGFGVSGAAVHGRAVRGRYDAITTQRVATIGDVALITDRDEGMTALHAACCSHAPIEVVSDLVHHCPAAVTMQDRSGWTPLHFVCHTALSVMEEAEATYTLGVVRVLIDAEPTVVLCEDRHGSTALEVFVTLFGNLLENDWTFGGRVPAESADRWFWSVTSLLISESASHYHGNEVRLVHNSGESNAAAENDGVDLSQQQADLPILHQLALMPPLQICNQLIQYIVAKFPEQVKEVDTDGNLPLHIAAGVYRVQNANGNVGGQRSDNPDTVRVLIEVYPEGARTYNNTKQLPLSVAMQSGRSWDGGIKALLECNPDALHSCKFACKLFPILLSRVATDSNAQAALFNLIRSKPEICQGCTLQDLKRNG